MFVIEVCPNIVSDIELLNPLVKCGILGLGVEHREVLTCSVSNMRFPFPVSFANPRLFNSTQDRTNTTQYNTTQHNTTRHNTTRDRRHASNLRFPNMRFPFPVSCANPRVELCFVRHVRQHIDEYSMSMSMSISIFMPTCMSTCLFNSTHKTEQNTTQYNTTHKTAHKSTRPACHSGCWMLEPHMKCPSLHTNHKT
jgi:hypothetical protein